MTLIRLTLFLTALLATTHAFAARPARQAAPVAESEARLALESILDLWRDGNYDALYERTSITGGGSREAFARRLAGASRRPACCWEKMQEVRVTVRGTDSVSVRATFGLEGGPGGTDHVTRAIRLVREDGVWKASRADILALAGEKRATYRYVKQEGNAGQ